MQNFTTRALCAVTILALAACSGQNGPTATLPANIPTTGTTGLAKNVVGNIVGVGDSLTAGEQSDGLLGTAGTGNGGTVQATQTHGAWALLWSQANGGASLTTASTSPLPLIASPGIGTPLFATPTGALSAIQVDCTGPNNALAFAYTTALQTRLATTPTYDLGVPGQTLHEALTQVGPNSPCSLDTGSPLDPLAAIVRAENEDFWPVLGTFPKGNTQIDDAVSLHPSLTTVWLGANDVLKFMFTNGAIAITPQSSFQADLVTIVSRLQGAGSNVMLVNLPDIPTSAEFVPVNPPVLAQYIEAKLVPAGIPAATAAQFAAGTSQILASQYGLGTNALLTLTGFTKVLTAIQTTALSGGRVPLTITLNTAGDFVIDQVAVAAETANVAYNQSIAAVAQQRQSPLADVHALFAQAAANGVPLSAKCCTAQYGGGLFSLDGLHPSNTGYALIANVFIQTINTTYGTAIPQVNVAAIYATDPYAPH